jgi:transposase
MPVLKVMKKSKRPSFARLSPLAKGRIIGLREEGAERADIAKRVKKTDGASPSLKTVDNVLERFAAEPEWDGLEDRTEGGRPRDVTSKQLEKIHKILLRDVGKHVVSATHVKRILKELRHIPDRTIQRSFLRLGYSYQYRRGKQAIGEKYKPARLKYCDWLLKQTQAFLNKFAYVDGTTFFRPRTEEERRDKQRASLGPRGWRLADGSDALEDKNIGPSAYAKSQGKPVKIWGLFFNGRLEYWVLPEEVDGKGNKKSANMTGARYNYFVSTFLAKWRRNCWRNFPKGEKVPLVKDFERFLRWDKTKEFDNMKAESDAGFSTVKLHPKLSPDLNAIEGWWSVLQQRLSLTAPVTLEPRADFLKRLRRTVTWLNKNARGHAKQLCTNQKERAKAIKKIQGARCKW